MTIAIERVGERIHLRAPFPVTGLSKIIPGANFSKTNGPRWSLPLSLDVCLLLRQRYGEALDIGPQLWGWAQAQRAEERRMASVREGGVELHRVQELYPRLAHAVTVGRPYQAVGASWIANGRNVLIGDTVGLGKTLQTLAGVVESGAAGPHLVICPKTAVRVVWRPEIHTWLPDHDVITVPDGRKEREAELAKLDSGVSLGRTWVIVHPEMVRSKSWWRCRGCGSETLVNHKPKQLVCGHDPRKTTIRHEHTFPELFAGQWGSIIADESDRSILRATGTPTMTRRGMELLRDDCVREDGLRIAQTGTPFRSRPHLLWSTLNWLRPAEFPAFWRWAEMFFEVTEGGYNGSMKIGKLRSDHERMLYRSLDKIMLRRTREEVLPHLPPKMYVGTEIHPGGPVGVWLPMEPKQAKSYQQMLENSTAEIEGGTLSAIGVLAEMTRLKQFATSAGKMEQVFKSVKCHLYKPHDPRAGSYHHPCPEYDGVARKKDGTPKKLHRHEEMVLEFRPELPSNKLDYILQVLEELGYPDDPQTKVVIVSQFTQTLELFGNAIKDHFKSEKMVAYITGKVTGDQRAEVVSAFNNPHSGPYVLMLNTKAGGSAITLDSADEMLLIDETFTPDDQTQAEGRIDNRRPEEKIVQRRYRYLRSLDSIEVGIAMTNAEREMDGHMILDGRRGLQYFKQVLGASR